MFETPSYPEYSYASRERSTPRISAKDARRLMEGGGIRTLGGSDVLGMHHSFDSGLAKPTPDTHVFCADGDIIPNHEYPEYVQEKVLQRLASLGKQN